MSLILAANFLSEKRFEFLGAFFPEVEVQSRLDQTELDFFPDSTIEIWGTRRPEGLKLLTAHFLQIDMTNQAIVASMGANLQAGGAASIQQLQAIDPMAYNTTAFGMQYQMMLKTTGTTGFAF